MAGTKLKTTGYTQDTAKNYLLDAGAIFANVEYDSVSKGYVGDPIGATVGGSKLDIVVTTRQPEVDGLLVAVKGNDVFDSVNATLEATVKEWRHANLSKALFADVTQGDGTTNSANYKVIKGRNVILDSDYYNNIGFVGKISGSSEPVIILLKNALNTAGLSIQTKDKDEAGINCKFEARADADKPEDFNGIWQILYPNARATTSKATNLKAENITTTGATIKWDAIQGAQSYVVRYGVHGVDASNDRLHYVETNEIVIDDALFAGTLNGLTLDIFVMGFDKVYAGTTEVDKANAAMNDGGHGATNWSDILQVEFK